MTNEPFAVHLTRLLPSGDAWDGRLPGRLTPEEADLAREHLTYARNSAMPTDEETAGILASILNKLKPRGPQCAGVSPVSEDE
jgi:hypothetical protein